MVSLQVLLINALISAVIWFVAVALYHLLTGGPDLRDNSAFRFTSFMSIVLLTLTSFVPFPAGYLFTLGVWWLAVRYLLELPLARTVIFIFILAALFFVSRLAILGALSY